MTLYVNEHEMIERYVDSLHKASTVANDFVSAKEQDKPRLFVDFVDGLKIVRHHVRPGGLHCRCLLSSGDANSSPAWPCTRGISGLSPAQRTPRGPLSHLRSH